MDWISSNIDPEIVEYLFHIKVRLPDKIGIYQRDVVPDLVVDFDRLEEQLQETPQMIAFWNMLLAEQKTIVVTLERKIKTIRGQIVENMLEKSHMEKVDIRSNDLKEIINKDKQLLEIEARLILNQKIEDRVETVVDALCKKLDSLRSLAGFKKIESRNA